MGCTTLRIPDELEPGKYDIWCFITVPDAQKGTIINFWRCHPTLMTPLTKVYERWQDKTDEEFHRQLRIKLIADDRLIPEMSTNQEWNDPIKSKENGEDT